MARRQKTDASWTPPASGEAAWYPDPADPTALRYWDGERWTEHVAMPAGPERGGGAASSDAVARIKQWVEPPR